MILSGRPRGPTSIGVATTFAVFGVSERATARFDDDAARRASRLQ